MACVGKDPGNFVPHLRGCFLLSARAPHAPTSGAGGCGAPQQPRDRLQVLLQDRAGEVSAEQRMLLDSGTHSSVSSGEFQPEHTKPLQVNQ